MPWAALSITLTPYYNSESQPLIRSGKTPKTGNTSSYGFINPITASAPGRYGTFEQHESATPPRLRENGWVEVHLPDSYVYYVNPSARVVADVEMRNDRLFSAVMRHLEMEQHKDAVEGAAEGAELWLRDAGSIKKGFIPVRWWVDHKERSVVFDKAFDVAIKRKALKKKKEDEDRESGFFFFWFLWRWMLKFRVSQSWIWSIGIGLLWRLILRMLL